MDKIDFIKKAYKNLQFGSISLTENQKDHIKQLGQDSNKHSLSVSEGIRANHFKRGSSDKKCEGNCCNLSTNSICNNSKIPIKAVSQDYLDFKDKGKH